MIPLTDKKCSRCSNLLATSNHNHEGLCGYCQRELSPHRGTKSGPYMEWVAAGRPRIRRGRKAASRRYAPQIQSLVKARAALAAKRLGMPAEAARNGTFDAKKLSDGELALAAEEFDRRVEFMKLSAKEAARRLAFLASVKRMP